MRAARTRWTRAFTTTELVVTIACLALLSAILLPALEKAKAKASRITCVGHLESVASSFRIWANDHHEYYPMQISVTNGGTKELISNGSVAPHFLALSNELSTPLILICPADKTRHAATIFASSLNETNISYFLNLDARQDFLSSVLSGDRNLTNRLEADGRWVNITNTSSIGWSKEMHSENGTIVFTDGSPHQFANGDARIAVELPNGTTNRLALP